MSKQLCKSAHNDREHAYNYKAFSHYSFKLIFSVRTVVVADYGRRADCVTDKNGNKYEVYIH